MTTGRSSTFRMISMIMSSIHHMGRTRQFLASLLLLLLIQIPAQVNAESPKDASPSSSKPEHLDGISTADASLDDEEPEARGQYIADSEHIWLLRPLQKKKAPAAVNFTKPAQSQLFYRHNEDKPGFLRSGPKLAITQAVEGGMASENGMLWLLFKQQPNKNKGKDEDGKSAASPPANELLVYTIQTQETKLATSPFSDKTINERTLSSLISQPSIPLPETDWQIEDFKVHQGRGFCLLKLKDTDQSYQLLGSYYSGWQPIDLPSQIQIDSKHASESQLWLLDHSLQQTGESPEGISRFESIPAIAMKTEDALSVFHYKIDPGDKTNTWSWHQTVYELNECRQRLQAVTNHPPANPTTSSSPNQSSSSSSSSSLWQLTDVLYSAGQTLAVFRSDDNQGKSFGLFALRPKGKSSLLPILKQEMITGSRMQVNQSGISQFDIAPHTSGFSILFVNERDQIQAASFNVQGEMIASPTELKLDQTFPFSRFFTMGTVFLTLLVTSAFMIIFWRRDPNWNQPRLPENTHLTDMPSRIIAALIDIAIPATIICAATNTHPLALFQNLPMDADVTELSLMLPGLMTCGLYIVFSTICEKLMKGQTLGKRLWGIRVVQLDGQAPSFLSCLFRNLLKLLEFIAPPLLFIAIFNPSRQRLGDMLARTLVIQSDAADDQTDQKDDQQI